MNKQEILNKIQQIFENRDGNLFIGGYGKSYTISFSSIGSSTKIDFKTLLELSKFLETELINVQTSQGSEGCETCGHGATTEFEIYVRFEKEEHLLKVF